MKNTITIIILLGLAALSGCKEKKTSSDNSTPDIMVKVAPVTTKAFASPIVSSGLITSDKESRLSFKIPGIISKMTVNEGDQVSKGQLLALLNQTEINAQLQQVQTSFDKAQRDYQRTSNLYKDSSATREEYDNSASGLMAAKQAYNLVKFNKQYAAIYANQSGRVIKKLMNEGELANPGMPVYIINSTSAADWVLRIGVSDRDWARVHLGDSAKITTDAYPGVDLAAIVSEIGSGADAVTGTFLVKVKIDPGNIRLANGLAAKISITPAEKHNYQFIPVDALIEGNKQTATVFSVNPDHHTIKKHRITIAYILDNQVAVQSGLEQTDNVVTDGSAYLHPDSKVKISAN